MFQKMKRQMAKRMPRDVYQFSFVCLCGMIGTQYDSCVTTQLKVVDIVNCFLFFLFDPISNNYQNQLSSSES